MESKIKRIVAKRLFVILAFFCLLVILLWGVLQFYPKKSVVIGEGMAAVIINSFYGVNYDRVLTEGSSSIFRTDSLVLYSVEDKAFKERIDVRFKDGSLGSITYYVLLEMIVDSLPKLHTTFGVNYKSNYIIPNIRSEIREEVYKTNIKDNYKDSIIYNINKPKYFNIIDFIVY